MVCDEPPMRSMTVLISPAALGFGVGCWLALSYLLGLYFRHFANFNKTYGRLAAGIALRRGFIGQALPGWSERNLTPNWPRSAARARSKRSMNLPRSQKLILPPEACIQNPDIGYDPAQMLPGFFRGAQRRRSPRGPGASMARFRAN